MKIWGITDIGAVRSDNQDSYRAEEIAQRAALAVVCDGMGGARAGNVASAVAADALVEAVKRTAQEQPDTPWPDVLLNAVALANRAVHDLSRANEEYRGMGTTLVAALITHETIWVANVGDSRCYYIREGAMTRVSRDHSLVEDLVERGEITREEARRHPKRNLITRALGVDQDVKADLFECGNCGGYLLLCSDGLSNMASEEELRGEIVHPDKETCCQRLLQLALDRGAPDNVTAVVVQL